MNSDVGMQALVIAPGEGQRLGIAGRLKVSTPQAGGAFEAIELDAAKGPLMAYVGTFSSPLRDMLPTQVDLPPGNGRGRGRIDVGPDGAYKSHLPIPDHVHAESEAAMCSRPPPIGNRRKFPAQAGGLAAIAAGWLNVQNGEGFLLTKFDGTLVTV